MYFLISKILKAFRSKLPIELERLRVCYPKNMEFWAKRKTTICVICVNFHLLCSIFFSIGRFPS